MNKFIDIKLDDEIYSVVFGLGKVVFVLEKALRLDQFYVFQVEYDNGEKTYYTEGGKADWCKDIKKCIRTIYYKHEVDFDAIDTKVERRILNKHKIDQYRNNDTLEMMSPAGGWIKASLMPDAMVDSAINDRVYHLFRRVDKISTLYM
ncbi:hypothetical protein N9A28_05250 [Sulfurimonas sp.]|nr:hypothetical protein [Sulfurimonas sp.]